MAKEMRIHCHRPAVCDLPSLNVLVLWDRVSAMAKDVAEKQNFTVACISTDRKQGMTANL